MPSIAANSRIKRILDEKRKREKGMLKEKDNAYGTSLRKKQRVTFADRVKFFTSNEELSAVGNLVLYDHQQDDKGVEFSLSIDETCHLDCTTMTSGCGIVYSPLTPSGANSEKYTAARHENGLKLSGELGHSDQDAQEELSFNEINTNRCRSISIESCNGSFMEPLITPPSSPRRVCTFLDDGNSEEATICEWPCNLTVDIAITAALESMPPMRRLSQVDLSEWE